MWFQAKSCLNMLEGNIFFNGPRAGINFNDGFGGNTTIRNNLLFNTVRETTDHGVFNSWDRQVYVTKVRDGKTASTIKQYDYIYNNFMIANYNAGYAIDNDDGSNYYKTYNNFFVYGGVTGMKNDGGGHDNIHYNNIYGYQHELCFRINGQLQGHQDGFYNNTCVLEATQSTYGNFDCGTQNSQNQWPKLGDNTIYITTGDESKIGLCSMTEADFQKKYPGIDDKTVIKGAPNNADIIKQAKALLMG